MGGSGQVQVTPPITPPPRCDFPFQKTPSAAGVIGLLSGPIMASKRERKKQLLVDLGFTAKEVQATEELAAKLDLNVTQVLQQSLRLYQARDAGFVFCKSTYEPVGCPAFD
jgi:hypothetical protein